MAVTLLNSAADLSGKTVMVLETAETITHSRPSTAIQVRHSL